MHLQSKTKICSFNYTVTFLQYFYLNGLDLNGLDLNGFNMLLFYQYFSSISLEKCHSHRNIGSYRHMDICNH